MKIYEYQSFGDTIDFADSLGFDSQKIDEEMERGSTYAGSEEFIADCLEDAALDFLVEQGFTVVQDGEILRCP